MAEQTKPKMVNIEINGRQIQAEAGKMLIQVTDAHGIYIPRFCYHEKLSVAANCRMCLVEIEGAKKPSPACATPVNEGMKVYTKSPTTRAYQKRIMEFLLINHPLDCPICDQGGECELQDIAMGYGKDISRFTEDKRVVPDPELGPLIATDMTRCIQCTRCVRFGEEIAGVKELGMVGRGEEERITTYVEETMESELSGNVIDICPVGALTSKPFRYRARAWELQQKDTISPHDGVGSNMHVHVMRNRLYRVVPKTNENLNEVWLADRDRFSYEGVNSDDRLGKPMLKKDGLWASVSWEEALDHVSAALQDTMAKTPDKIGAIASESATTEELYLLQKLIRNTGSANIDSRLKLGEYTQPVTPGIGLDCEINAILNADNILVLGGNPRKSQPIMNLKIKKAVDQGAHCMVVSSLNTELTYPYEWFSTDAQNLVEKFGGIAHALLEKTANDQAIDEKLSGKLSRYVITNESRHIADKLCRSEKPTVLLGDHAILNDQFTTLYALYGCIKMLANTQGGILSFGSNARGALLAGALPYLKPKGEAVESQGADTQAMLTGHHPLDTLFLHNVEPELDTQFGDKAVETLAGIDKVICLSPFVSETMKTYADVILPIAPFSENAGSYFNYAGQRQRFKTPVKPFDSARPAWKIFRVLGNYLQFEGFEHVSTQDVLHEFDEIPAHSTYDDFASLLPDRPIQSKNAYHVQKMVSLYGVDNVVRRSQPLQATPDHLKATKVHVAKEIADHLNIEHDDKVTLVYNDKEIDADVLINDKLAPKTILLPMGCAIQAARHHTEQLVNIKAKQKEAAV